MSRFLRPSIKKSGIHTINLYLCQCQIIFRIFTSIIDFENKAKITIGPRNNYYVLTLLVLPNFHITLPEKNKASQIHCWFH